MEEAAEELIGLLDQAAGRETEGIKRARERYLELAGRYSDDPAFLAALKAESALRGIRLEPAKDGAAK
jgi:hypothetical protein